MTDVAVCLCGQVRTLAYAPFQTMLHSRMLQPWHAELFLVVSTYWSQMKLNTTAKQLATLNATLAPVAMEVQTDHIPIEARASRCFYHVLKRESVVNRRFVWVVRSRPDVYLHCTLQPFSVQQGWIASAWDYLTVVPRNYAPQLFTSVESCRTTHPAICHACRVVSAHNATLLVHFRFVDLSRSCQLHHSELRKHRCNGVNTSYVTNTSTSRCPRLDDVSLHDAWKRSRLWTGMARCP